MVEVLVRRIDPESVLPAYAHPGDAGADLCTTVDLELAPGERAMVPTGISIALPDGYVALVHPRSGLAARFGLSIVNAPGTVDAGYRGEVKVLLVNLDPGDAVRLQRGDRIAQLVFQRVERARFVEVERLPGSHRGEGGYGSTGGFSPGTVASAEIPLAASGEQDAAPQDPAPQDPAPHDSAPHDSAPAQQAPALQEELQ